jgi:hypothetical protein
MYQNIKALEVKWIVSCNIDFRPQKCEEWALEGKLLS